MAEPELKIVVRSQGNVAALKDGTVEPQGVRLAWTEVPVLIDAFRRMVRGLEFDLSEMAMTTYVCARAHGVPFTALPIFIVRAFHHGAILTAANANVTPKGLEGAKVGVNRGYTVTTGLWARAVLQDEYGVDLSKITWVLSGDEHVADYRPPPNVVPVEKGKDVTAMVKSGELAAGIGIAADADLKPLIANASEAGLRALRERGHYPINHLIVVKDDVLGAQPSVAPALFAAFAEAKRRYLQRLREGTIEHPTDADATYRKVMEIVDDPLPYGIEPNRRAIDDLIRNAVTQGIIERPVAAEELFAASTLGLAA